MWEILTIRIHVFSIIQCRCMYCKIFDSLCMHAENYCNLFWKLTIMTLNDIWQCNFVYFFNIRTTFAPLNFFLPRPAMQCPAQICSTVLYRFLDTKCCTLYVYVDKVWKDIWQSLEITIFQVYCSERYRRWGKALELRLINYVMTIIGSPFMTPICRKDATLPRSRFLISYQLSGFGTECLVFLLSPLFFRLFSSALMPLVKMTETIFIAIWVKVFQDIVWHLNKSSKRHYIINTTFDPHETLSGPRPSPGWRDAVPP